MKGEKKNWKNKNEQGKIYKKIISFIPYSEIRCYHIYFPPESQKLDLPFPLDSIDIDR
jgi:hypothetical protein